MIKELVELFNMILEKRKIPKDWKLLDTILLYKKGDKHNISNYRPISLGTTVAKIFSRAIENRIRGDFPPPITSTQ